MRAMHVHDVAISSSTQDEGEKDSRLPPIQHVIVILHMTSTAVVKSLVYCHFN
jgi:hypothetical protein